MRHRLAHLVVACICVPAAAAAQGAAGSNALSLFDGKSFEGWEGNLAIFRVQEGAIVGGSMTQKIARNEFLCTTRTFGDFDLRLKFKLLGGDSANAGVQFRTKRIPNDHKVIGYQADMGADWWGALYDESRRKKVLKGPDKAKMRALVKPAEWNDYVIRAEGSRIQLWLDGVQTVDYTEGDPSVDRRGVVCLQIHAGAPSEAWYKDITLRELRK
jgi:hypothetical protein